MNTKNLKPLDLQAALNGEPVMLRDGSKAFVRHHETELNTDDHRKLVGYTSIGSMLTWREDGRFVGRHLEPHRDIVGMYPKTRTVNGFEVPAPEKIEPKKHATCFHVNVSHDDFYISYSWMGDRYDFQALKRGIVFLSKEDAVATAKAMLGIN